MIIAAGPSLPASHVPSVTTMGSVAEIEHVLPEVPDGSVVGLRIEVVGDLRDPAVEERVVSRDDRLDLDALPFDDRVSESSVTSVRKGSPSTRPKSRTDSCSETGEQRVRDVRGIGERGHRDVDPLAVGSEREVSGNQRLRDRRRLDGRR
jgi:hypothetical protein